MPLDRAHTTIGGYTAMRAYPPFTIGVGLSFMLTDPDRLRNSPGLDYAAQFVPLNLWGAGFFTVGVLLAVAVIRKSRKLYLRVLPFAMVWFAAWSLLLLLSALDGGRSSFSAWTWPAVIVWHMWAVQLSLESRQHDIPPLEPRG